MNHIKNATSTQERTAQICEFVEKSSGLNIVSGVTGTIGIHQKTDGKTLRIHVDAIEDVISRFDSDGQPFLQINFLDGKKILLTERLVGFKPAASAGLDMTKIPKVVTTPDLVSVVEAIEESLSAENTHPLEIEVLRKVFDAVIEGGEAIGFDLQDERAWLKRLANSKYKASA